MLMRVVSVLLLCGLSFVLTSPTCPDYPAYCNKSKEQKYGKFYPETAAELEEFCNDIIEDLDCQLEFIERCPNTLTGAFHLSIKQYRNSFANLCDKTGSLRKKFLEKGSCLNERTTDAETNCDERVKEIEFCKRTTEVIQCVEEEINEMCGGDGADVVAQLYKPKYAWKDVFCTTE